MLCAGRVKERSDEPDKASYHRHIIFYIDIPGVLCAFAVKIFLFSVSSASLR